MPRIQATLWSGQEQMTERRWEIPARRQGFSFEEAIDRRFRSSFRNECNRDSNGNENLNNTCDNVAHVVFPETDVEAQKMSAKI